MAKQPNNLFTVFSTNTNHIYPDSEVNNADINDGAKKEDIASGKNYNTLAKSTSLVTTAFANFLALKNPLVTFGHYLSLDDLSDTVNNTLYSKLEVNNLLDLKANALDVSNALSLKADELEVINALNTKVDKITGKGLSENDFTNSLKIKLDNLENLYDIIIKTQQEFENLIASPNWLGATSVAFVGDGGSLEFLVDELNNLGVRIPSNVITINGFNKAKIKIINSLIVDNVITGIYYDELPTNSNTFKNIDIYVEGTDTYMYGVKNLINIINCNVETKINSVTSWRWTGRAFYSCKNIYNSKGKSNIFNEGTGGAFDNCENIYNCYGYSVLTGPPAGSQGDASGFRNCKNIIGSYGFGESLNNRRGIGFDRCEQVINCIGKGVGTTNGSGYAFRECSYGSNNKDDGSSTAATSLTMTKWSTETND